MPFLCGFISIVTLSYGVPRFVRNKAIPICNSTLTFVSNSSRINPLGRVGFLLSSNGSRSHLPKAGYDSVGGMRMFHGHAVSSLHLRASSIEPTFTDGNTSGLGSSDSASLVSLDPQWVTGFTDGEGSFSISA